MHREIFFLRPIGMLLCVAVLLCASTVVFAGTCPEAMTSFWSLEEASYPYHDGVNPDAGNTASCAAQCPARIDDGAVGGAGRFSGSNSGLSVANGAAFDWSSTDSFSIELWVRPAGLPGGVQTLVGRTAGNFNWSIALQADGTALFTLSDGGGSAVLESPKVLSRSLAGFGIQWHHVAAVRNAESNTVQLYVDGQPADSATQSFQNGFAADNTPLSIAWSGNAGNAQRFDGDLDEVAVYSRALDVGEIRSHYFLARHYCELYDFPVDIMPLGDSITYDNVYGDTRSEGDRYGYRVPLWRSLNNGMYWFEFIGSQPAGQNADPAFDPDNAGFPGIRISELTDLLHTSLPSYLARYNQPYDYLGGVTSDTPYLSTFSNDLILLHIGTNGLTDTGVIAGFVDDLSGLLDEIDAYSTNITVVVARIIHDLNKDFPAANNSASDTSVTHQYNDALEQMVNQRIAAGDKLLLADMEDGAGLIYSADADMVADGLHPSSSGYAKMAAQWYARLGEFLPQVVLPEITSKEDTVAAAGKQYQYQVTATGTPRPTFSLTAAPAGMTIGAESGLITWTAPNSVGQTVNVTVEARNIDPTEVSWATVATQDFTISINEKDDNNGGGGSSGGGGGSSGCFIQSTISPAGAGKGRFMWWAALVLFTMGWIGIRFGVGAEKKL